jgi:hypothetical protein
VKVPFGLRTKLVKFPLLSMPNPAAAPEFAIPFKFVPAAALFPLPGPSKLVKVYITSALQAFARKANKPKISKVIFATRPLLLMWSIRAQAGPITENSFGVERAIRITEMYFHAQEQNTAVVSCERARRNLTGEFGPGFALPELRRSRCDKCQPGVEALAGFSGEFENRDAWAEFFDIAAGGFAIELYGFS